MKDNVDAAIPVLTRMGYGYWGSVTEDERIALARWIAQFTMSYEFADRRTVKIPQAVRDEFRETGHLSDEWLIAVGYAEPEVRTDRIHHRAFRFEGGAVTKHGQVTGILFGKLACMSYYLDHGVPDRMASTARDLRLAIIHPKQEKPLSKPLWTHNDDFVALVVNACTTGP